ncbi:uncharacterized protein F4807DRAFT_431069 [Annulohypoxylon truncatum]|uniref:uncharacterized protein n=1 Tax=Annulohypoxylon truncatum TaxID=327061 RepID=UPI002007E052|nr:uncharacterized protein F4807DRAFT_431069 [Annulohypoxylon truncatum]KAI1208370.1 hypothetical protein F4807DRAFT_431069 [Annulohypoxylon truncatum]
MALHYPLNGLDLSFSRYEHKPLGARGVMVNRIMEDYMAPRRVKADVYKKSIRGGLFSQIKARDRLLGLDVQVLSKILQTDYNWLLKPADIQKLYASPYNIMIQCLDIFIMSDDGIDIGSAVLGLVERHYLESGPSMRIWLRHFHSYCSHAAPKHGPGWKKDVVEHLRDTQPASETQYTHHLYSGGHYLPINVSPEAQFCIDPCFTSTLWYTLLKRPLRSHSSRGRKATVKSSRKTPLGNMTSLHRGRPRHSNSVPPVGSWGTASIQGFNSSNLEEKFVIHFPHRRLSELDKLSRRRSLSRTHIREMFTDKPELFYKKPEGKDASKTMNHRCDNCAQYTHHTKHCPSKCGFCGSPFHKASGCQVKSSNRCKCRPFPQYHIAQECYVRCSRVCGCPYHPGHFKHQNAMMCSYRCCMCGIKGHSGRKCSLKKCPCGEQHLTQDCRWKVECPVKGCNYYLCRLHCRECGKKKEKGAKDCFVSRTCQDCLKNGRPALAKS